MSETKHTPGPWEHRNSGECLLDNVLTKYPDHVVQCYKDELGRRCTAFVATCESATLNNAANARLIAAAPELLKALTALLPVMINWLEDAQGDDPYGWQGLADGIAEAEAAIRKTKGDA